MLKKFTEKWDEDWDSNLHSFIQMMNPHISLIKTKVQTKNEISWAFHDLQKLIEETGASIKLQVKRVPAFLLCRRGLLGFFLYLLGKVGVECSKQLVKIKLNTVMEEDEKFLQVNYKLQDQSPFGTKDLFKFNEIEKVFSNQEKCSNFLNSFQHHFLALGATLFLLSGSVT